MKKKQTIKKLVLRKKAISQLRENGQKTLQGGGACSGAQIPDSPLCAPPTMQVTCDYTATLAV